MTLARMRETLSAMLVVTAAAGFAACGDDGGSPTGPIPTVPPPVEMQSDEDAARQSVEAWLSLIDAGNTSEAYGATGSSFQERVTAEEFRNAMEERGALLGAFVSRTLSSTERLTMLPDASPGDYFVFEFDGVYELRPNARERITAVSESGEWPIVGIYLIPPVDRQSDEDAARQSVEAWLSLIDAGNTSEAYGATGSSFQERVTAEEFRNAMEERGALLGAFVSRTLSSTERLTMLPDASPGDYFVFEFDGVYELRPNARERVTAVSESGEWPVVGIYLIR